MKKQTTVLYVEYKKDSQGTMTVPIYQTITYKSHETETLVADKRENVFVKSLKTPNINVADIKQVLA